jgi:hypothetical protein
MADYFYTCNHRLINLDKFHGIVLNEVDWKGKSIGYEVCVIDIHNRIDFSLFFTKTEQEAITCLALIRKDGVRSYLDLPGMHREKLIQGTNLEEIPKSKNTNKKPY